MKTIDRQNFIDIVYATDMPWEKDYYAMYSSLWEGITTDPRLMMLPLDDHLVHRGDGVFDTAKCINGALYNFDAHMVRLMRSASSIKLDWKEGAESIKRLTYETVRRSGKRDCSVRVILARGPGSFGVSPYDSPQPVLYIVVYSAGTPFMHLHPEGATARRSLVPSKSSDVAGIKSCNYMPNVMMRRESHDWGVDFTVTFDRRGFMAEGSTENFGIISADHELLFPRRENIMIGTTMLRLLHLAQELVADGTLKSIEHRDISEEEVLSAHEVLIVGTTLNVVSVREYEGRTIGDGKPGAIFKRLEKLLENDINHNPAVRTVIFD